MKRLMWKQLIIVAHQKVAVGMQWSLVESSSDMQSRMMLISFMEDGLKLMCSWHQWDMISLMNCKYCPSVNVYVSVSVISLSMFMNVCMLCVYCFV